MCSPMSSRTVYFTGAAATFLLFEFYIATLTSYITASEPPKEITQLEDVLTMGYDFITWKDTSLDARFINVSTMGWELHFTS